MSLFRRRRARRADLEAREAQRKKPLTPPAVPLTRADVQLLLTGLTETDRLRMFYRPDISGPGFYASAAAEVMRTTALAGALGHDTVPFPTSCSVLSSTVDLDRVHRDLLKWAPREASTAAFGLLVLKVAALSALSSRSGWTCTRDRDANAWCWTTPPTVDEVTRLLPGA